MADEKNDKNKRIDNALKVFTDMLIERMEDASKDLSWTKGWASGKGYTFGLPQNIKGNLYTGGNALLLQMICGKNGYSMPVFMTYLQAKELGAKVKKGERSVPVFKWGFTVYDENRKKISIEDYDKLSDEDKNKCSVRPYLKMFPEFNIDQTTFKEVHPDRYEALKNKFGTLEVERDTVGMYKNEALNRVLHGNWVCPIYNDSKSGAFYNSMENAIHVPSKESFNIHPGDMDETFKDGQEYYSTILHEMAHSTGHESLLARPGITDSDGFGGKVYAKEELVAELTAAMVCNTMGFDKRITENSAAYLKSWASQLRKEPRYIVSVMSDVNKASRIELEHIDEQRKALGLKPLLEGNLDGIEERKENEEQKETLQNVNIVSGQSLPMTLDELSFTKEGDSKADEPFYWLESESVKNQDGEDRTVVLEYSPLSESEKFSAYYYNKETQMSEPYNNLSEDAKSTAIAYMDGKLKTQWNVARWEDFSLENSEYVNNNQSNNNNMAQQESNQADHQKQVPQQGQQKPMQWSGYYSNLNEVSDIDLAIDDDQLKSMYQSGKTEELFTVLKDAQKEKGAEWSLENLETSEKIINNSEVIAEDDKYIVLNLPYFEQPFMMYEKVSAEQILDKIHQQGLSEDDSEIAHAIANQDIERQFKELRSNMLEMPNGESVYLTYDADKNKIIAGGATNAGQIPENEFEYDHNMSLEQNLQEVSTQLEDMEEYQLTDEQVMELAMDKFNELDEKPTYELEDGSQLYIELDDTTQTLQAHRSENGFGPGVLSMDYNTGLSLQENIDNFKEYISNQNMEGVLGEDRSAAEPYVDDPKVNSVIEQIANLTSEDALRYDAGELGEFSIQYNSLEHTLVGGNRGMFEGVKLDYDYDKSYLENVDALKSKMDSMDLKEYFKEDNFRNQVADELEKMDNTSKTYDTGTYPSIIDYDKQADKLNLHFVTPEGDLDNSMPVIMSMDYKHSLGTQENINKFEEYLDTQDVDSRIEKIMSDDFAQGLKEDPSMQEFIDGNKQEKNTINSKDENLQEEQYINSDVEQYLDFSKGTRYFNGVVSTEVNLYKDPKVQAVLMQIANSKEVPTYDAGQYGKFPIKYNPLSHILVGGNMGEYDGVSIPYDYAKSYQDNVNTLVEKINNTDLNELYNKEDSRNQIVEQLEKMDINSRTYHISDTVPSMIVYNKETDKLDLRFLSSRSNLILSFPVIMSNDYNHSLSVEDNVQKFKEYLDTHNVKERALEIRKEDIAKQMDEKKYYSSFAYMQFEQDKEQFDQLKEAGKYEEMLNLAAEYDQEQEIDFQYVEDKAKKYPGDDLLCENEDYAIVYNSSVGGDYSLYKKYSENELREEIDRVGFLGDNPSDSIQKIANNMIAEEFSNIKYEPVWQMPSGDSLYFQYNKDTNQIEVGTPTNVGLNVEYKSDYDRDKSLDENLSEFYEDMIQIPDYQAKEVNEDIEAVKKEWEQMSEPATITMDNGEVLDLRYNENCDTLEIGKKEGDKFVIVDSISYDHDRSLKENFGYAWEGMVNKPEYLDPVRMNIAKEFGQFHTTDLTMPNGEKLNFQYDYDTNKVNVGKQPEQGNFEIKESFDFDKNRSVAENMLLIYSSLSQKDEYQKVSSKQEVISPHEDSNIATDVATDAKEIAATGIPMERAEVMAKEISEGMVHEDFHKEQDQRAAEDKAKADAVKTEEQAKQKEQEKKEAEEKKKQEKPSMVVTHAALLLTALATAKENDGIWLNSGFRDNASFLFSQTPISGYNNLMMNLHSEQNGYRSNVYTYYDKAKEQGMPVMAGEASLPFSWTNWQYINMEDKSKVITSRQYHTLSKDDRKLYSPRSVRTPQRIYNIDQTIFPAKSHDAYVSVLKEHGDKLETVQLDKQYSIYSQYHQMSLKHPGAIILMHDDDVFKSYKSGAAKLHKILGVPLGKADYNGKNVDYAEFNKKKLETYLQKLSQGGHQVAIVDKIADAKLIKQVPNPDEVLNKAYKTARAVAKTDGMGYDRVMVVQPTTYDVMNNKFIVSGMRTPGLDNATDSLNKTNEIYRTLAAVVGTENRLDRGGRNNLTPFDDAKYDKLVQELAAGVMMSRQGLPSQIAKENMDLIPYWERELKECPRLMGMIERDVNNTVEVIDNLEEGRKPNYSKMLGNAPKKEVRTKADYAAIKKINDYPSVEFKEFVLVKNTKDSVAQVILPAGASLDDSKEISGMRKDRITHALKEEGFKEVKYYNAGGTLGLKEPNEYFADKEVSVVKLNQYNIVETQKLNLDKYVTKPVPEIETFRCMKNDDGKYFFLIKPANEAAFCIEPEKVHLNSFFQAKDKTEMKKALGEMYYKLASAHPDVKKDFITPKPVDVDYSRIERAGMLRDKDGKTKVIHAVIDGKQYKKAVTQSQWDRLWFAKDKKTFARGMAAIVFGSEMKQSKAQEQNMFVGQKQTEKKDETRSKAVDNSDTPRMGGGMGR